MPDDMDSNHQTPNILYNFLINRQPKEALKFVTANNCSCMKSIGINTYVDPDWHQQNIRYQDQDGITPLMIASQYGYHNIVKELVKTTACLINHKSVCGHTALSLASTPRIQKILSEAISKK